MIRPLALALMMASPAAADYADGVDGDEVQALLVAALQANGLEGDPAISMLRSFPACTTVPKVTPKWGTWTTVELSCSAPAWKRAMRTQTEARYQPGSGDSPDMAGKTVVVLRESLPRGTVLRADHLELAEISERASDKVFFDPSHIIGRALTVNLGQGRAVLSRHLDADWLIRAKNPVEIAFSGGVFAVTTAGEALEDGQLGDMIRVRNRNSGSIIRAIVAGPNPVVVTAKMN